MSKIFFHPDIDYQETKSIEEKFNSKNEEFLLNKASDAISKKICQLINKDHTILIICGPGSNGLDGIFSATKLSKKKYKVRILMTKSSSHDRYIKKFNLSKYILKNVENFNHFDCIVDCIFGIGLNRELSSDCIRLINRINKSNSLILSVDVPTGLDPYSGTPYPVCINCDLLITFLTYKRGLFTNIGRDAWKNIVFLSLIDQEIVSNNYLITANKKFTDNTMKKYKSEVLKESQNHSDHKKSNGISCIIAGETPYHGALIMSAMASIKSGCQYLQVITDPEYAHTLPMIYPEIIATTFSVDDFKKDINNFSNILIGPGLNSSCKDLLDIALENLDSLNSLIIDAGALVHLKKNIIYSNKLIVTPHPGEAAKILDISVKDVQANRYNAAMKIHKMFNCIVILKGSGTIIYNGENFYTCMDGNYRMAVAGMGDILSGILLTELSSPIDNMIACLKSVVFHSYASDFLLEKTNNNKFLPTDIPDIYASLTKS